MFGNGARGNPQVSVTRDKEERRVADRVREFDMTTIYNARISVDSLDVTSVIGANSRRRNGANVYRLTSENRGTKLDNDSGEKNRAPNPHPQRSVLGPLSHAFNQ